MKTISGKPFKGEQIELDGHAYDGCDFTSCTFVYEGREAFGLSNNRISSDCKFEFRGAAANTLAAMKAIYGMGDWGRRHIVTTFETIAPDRKNMN